MTTHFESATPRPAAQLVQGRLSGLIGRSSGYVESLPAAVQYRLTALKGVQRDHSALEAEFQREIFELEKRFAEKYRPLYERRRAIIEGKDEPKEDEIKKGVEVEEEEEEDEDSDFEDEEDVDDEEDDEREKPKKERGVKPSDEELAQAPKGIPEFWLTTLKNHLGLSELITERDEDALRHLVDIRVAYPADNRSGFTLVFEFGEGAKQFFENTKLEKTYYYQDEVGYEGDFVYDHAEGTKIQWKEGKDLTVKIETKKQRNKSGFFALFWQSLEPGPLLTPPATRRHQPDSHRQEGGPDRLVLLLLQPASTPFGRHGRRGRRRRLDRVRPRREARTRLPDRRGPEGASDPARGRLFHGQGAQVRAARGRVRLGRV